MASKGNRRSRRLKEFVAQERLHLLLWLLKETDEVGEVRMNFRNSNGAQIPIYFQVTAIVDILMVLLVFFLYNYAIGQDEGQLKVTVPSAKHTDTTPVSAPVFINVQKNGNIVVNSRSLTESQLGDLLAELIRNNPQQNVLLRADKDVAYERILKILDICEGANVEGVGFSATQMTVESPATRLEH